MTPDLIYFLNDRNGAFGFGHAAVIIPNGNGCTYYSFDDSNRLTTVPFNNIFDAFAAAKEGRYTRWLAWTVLDPAEWSSAANAAALFDGSQYGAFSHNCWDMVYGALRTANVNVQYVDEVPNDAYNVNLFRADFSGDL